MDHWINHEKYPDPTAGEAIDRVLCPEPARGAAFDEQGCLCLARAVVVQAVKDCFDALRIPDPDGNDLRRLRDLERFFLSASFRRLTGLDGPALLRGIRKEAKKNERP